MLRVVYMLLCSSARYSLTGGMGDTQDHTEGNAITASQQIPNHQALMLKVSLFNVLNFKDAARVI